jgi:hypothetical protein
MDATSRPRRQRTTNRRSERDEASDSDSDPQPLRADVAGIADILERAERLSAAQIRMLASTYRGETTAGAQDPDGRARAHRRARAISIALARSGRSAETLQLQESASLAVRSAAANAGLAERRLLGIVADAELAVGEAALAVLFADHLSGEIAALLREPLEKALARRGGGVAGQPGEADR